MFASIPLPHIQVTAVLPTLKTLATISGYKIRPLDIFVPVVEGYKMKQQGAGNECFYKKTKRSSIRSFVETFATMVKLLLAGGSGDTHHLLSSNLITKLNVYTHVN